MKGAGEFPSQQDLFFQPLEGLGEQTQEVVAPASPDTPPSSPISMHTPPAILRQLPSMLRTKYKWLPVASKSRSGLGSASSPKTPLPCSRGDYDLLTIPTCTESFLPLSPLKC